VTAKYTAKNQFLVSWDTDLLAEYLYTGKGGEDKGDLAHEEPTIRRRGIRPERSAALPERQDREHGRPLQSCPAANTEL